MNPTWMKRSATSLGTSGGVDVSRQVIYKSQILFLVSYINEVSSIWLLFFLQATFYEIHFFLQGTFYVQQPFV